MSLALSPRKKPSTEPPSQAAPVTAAFAKSDVLSYAADIRPLFREFDKVFMKRLDGIDIDDAKSVRRRAKFIAKNLKSGRLPYDGNWPRERVDLFNQWRKGGKKG